LGLVLLNVQLLLGRLCPAVGGLELDLLLGDGPADLVGVEADDDLALLDVGALGQEVDDLAVLALDLALGGDGAGAFELAAFGEDDGQVGAGGGGGDVGGDAGAGEDPALAAPADEDQDDDGGADLPEANATNAVFGAGGSPLTPDPSPRRGEGSNAQR